MTPSPSDTIAIPLGFIDELTTAASIEAVMEIGTAWLNRMLPSDRNSIAIVDDGRLVASSRRFDGGANVNHDITELVPGTPRAEVIRTARSIEMGPDELAATSSAPLARLYDSGIRNLIITPLMSAGRAVGTISIASRSGKPYGAGVRRELWAIGNWIAVQANLMQQVRATARQANTDNLTGLANRHALMRHLGEPGVLTQVDDRGRRLGLLHIDLDHFKAINDSLGHSAGDTVLVAAANAMRAMTRPGDMVARVGGDEFIILSRTDPEGRHLDRLGRALSTQIRRPISIEGIVTRVGASIGTAIGGPDTGDADDLIGNADLALYESKRAGRNRVMAFRPEMRAAFEESQQLAIDLQDAVLDERFEPYFQPQVSLATGELTGFEMLARWQHPTRGMLCPADFLDMAVEAGTLDRIDPSVRAKGLAALRQLRDQGWDAPKMSFNASVRTLHDPNLADAMTAEVRALALCPTDLVLELNHAQLPLDDKPVVQRNILALAKAGFGVELDDFGTSGAAIANLAALKLSGIKIDHALVAPLPERSAVAILGAIVTLAHELGLSVGASGVETPAQFTTLKRLNCDYGQGKGVAAPMPLTDLVAFLETYGRAPISVVG